MSQSRPPSFSDPAFAQSLPASYRRNFDDRAISEHTRIARARNRGTVSVGAFSSNKPGTALCVIADDRPGLLATISAALVIEKLDVIEAEAYTRREPGCTDEALDVFWVRHDPAENRNEPITPEHIRALERTLTGLLQGTLDREPASETAPRGSATPSSVETVVRFLEGEDGSFATLEVETGDRSGLLLALAQALFQQRVQIVASQVKTDGTRVLDRFHIVELDNTPISSTRRLEIQVAVLTAVDPIIGQSAEA